MPQIDDSVRRLTYEDIDKLRAELTDEQRTFIDAYLDNEFDIRRARHVAGITHQTALRYLRQDARSSVIVRWYMDRHAVTSEETLARLSDIARADIGEFLDIEEDIETGEEFTRFNLKRAKLEGRTHLIRKLELKSDGSIRVELHDSLKALEMFARTHKLLADNVSNTYNQQIDWSSLLDAYLARLADGENVAQVLRDYAQERSSAGAQSYS